MWPKKAATLFVRDYQPKVDMTKELNADKKHYYQSQIGILRWMVELGRVDIITDISMLSLFLESS